MLIQAFMHNYKKSGKYCKLNEFLSRDKGGVALTKKIETDGRTYVRTERQMLHRMSFAIKNDVSIIKRRFLP